MAVQIAVKEGRRDKVIEHLGSAHTEAELAALMEIGRHRIAPDQLALDLTPTPPAVSGLLTASAPVGTDAVVESKRSALLWEVLHEAYTRLGLGEAVGGDRAFEQMVLARLIEPTSKAQVPRVLGDLGLESVSTRTLFRSLARAHERGYRESLSGALFEHVTASGGLALCLYDVTTLYFEAEREDDLRKVGYSKERRVDPQVIVGLLVDRHGFPLQVGCWEGNKAETTTIIPIVEAFQAAHGIEELVVVAGRRHALSRQPQGPGRSPAAVHRWGPTGPGPRRPGGPLPLGRGRLHRRPGHRHHHPQEGLQERAGQEPQGRAGVGPAHPPGLMEGGMGLLQAPCGPGQPDPDRPGQPRPGHPSPARSAPRAHVLSPSIKAIRSSMRRPSPEPGPWWASRATSPTFLHA